MPTIIPKDTTDAQRLARELLAAAGEDRGRVRTNTTPSGGVAFVVDDDLAAAVGTGDYVPVPESEKPAPKRAPRKTAAK